MIRVRARAMLSSTVLLTAAACLARFPAPPATLPEPALDPTRFFSGRTEGQGSLKVRLGADRTLRVQSVGTTQRDGDFRLDQTIQFGNGAVENRTWLLRRVNAQHFTATLSDAQGPVRAESNGNLLHLRYRLRRAVYMDQWLYLQADGRSLENRAQITVLGIPWARLTETISPTGGQP